ncbi:hypothetical protein [Halocynthiibacter namhaensis]|nr:hypothetical protein [Halocynthiibacter namhaensis]
MTRHRSQAQGSFNAGDDVEAASDWWAEDNEAEVKELHVKIGKIA